MRKLFILTEKGYDKHNVLSKADQKLIKTKLVAFFKDQQTWKTIIYQDQNGKIFFTFNQNPYGQLFVSLRNTNVAFTLCDFFEWEDNNLTVQKKDNKSFSSLQSVIEKEMPVDVAVYRALAKNKEGFSDLKVGDGNYGVLCNVANLPKEDQPREQIVSYSVVETAWNPVEKKYVHPVRCVSLYPGKVLADLSL